MSTVVLRLGRIELNGYYVVYPLHELTQRRAIYVHSFSILSVPFGWAWVAAMVIILIGLLVMPLVSRCVS